jgi:class 3 adenylate cyclase
METQSSSLNCLVHAQAFETAWAYFSQSAGRLYSDECRRAARRFVESLRTLGPADPRVLAPMELIAGHPVDVGVLLQDVEDWARGGEPLFLDEELRTPFFVLIQGVKGLLVRDLGIDVPISIGAGADASFSARVLRWKAHLPSVLLEREDLDDLVFEASQSESIVVVGDIRRSQDLMTYAATPDDFSRRMVVFIQKTRDLIDENAGFFDKFTGDGFIVYFNEALCRAAGRSHIDRFLSFVKAQSAFGQDLFQDWAGLIRKRPTGPIGLAMGADIGRVAFHDVHDHLVAVGDAIVWAARMAAAANAGEVLVNNLLQAKLTAVYTRILGFSPREAQTKSGESFLAQVLNPQTGDR